MISMLVIGLLSGMLVGVRHRIFALIPVLTVGVVAIVALATSSHEPWLFGLARIGAFALATQVGYVGMMIRTQTSVAPQVVATR